MTTKPKRRVLTAREKLMRDRYTRIVKMPNGHFVFITVGFQSFSVGGESPTAREAEWLRRMLAIAISKIEL